jgi:hypothetical protein
VLSDAVLQRPQSVAENGTPPARLWVVATSETVAVYRVLTAVVASWMREATAAGCDI